MTFSLKTSSGKNPFPKTEALLKRRLKADISKVLHRHGQAGVSALSAATPVDSNVSASSWSYEVIVKGGWYGISWTNSNTVNGVPLVILLQYGHGTGTGGYVQGRDFINPAIQATFQTIAADVKREVKAL